MISDVAIANLALTKVNGKRIISFADPNESARTVSAIYEAKRDDELRRARWRFAKRRVTLPALAAAPPFGYGIAYQLPADCLRVDVVGPYLVGDNLADYRTWDSRPYVIEGRSILTDLPAPLRLEYGARVVDPTQFDSCFVEALACRIAYEIAEAITGSASKKGQCFEEYTAAISTARNANAIEMPPATLADNAWMLSRL